MLIADGYDEAVLGVAQRCSQPDLIAYDVEKIIEILMTRDEMTYEEAVEFFEFNIAGAWVGEETPCFINKGTLMEIRERVIDPPEHRYCDECSARFYPADDDVLCYECKTFND